MPKQNYLTNMVPPQVLANQDLGEEMFEVSSDPVPSDGIEIEIIAEQDEETGELKLHQVEFYENLAEVVSFDKLDEISRELMDSIEQDKLDRQEKDRRYADTIKRLGYSEEKIGGANFAGASTVTHPMLSEMCIDFSSRAIKEILPPGGCVRTKIVGTADSVKLDLAERKRKFLNYLLTEKMNYRTTLEKLFSQLPLGGSQYLKLWWDETYQEVQCCFVPIDQVYLPYYTSDFYKAERLTHIQRITRIEWDRAVSEGKYSLDHLEDVRAFNDANAENDYGFQTTEEQLSMAEQARRDVDGIGHNSGSNYDEQSGDSSTRTIYEVHTYLKLDGQDELGDDGYLPYIVTIDTDTGAVIGLYRNWDKVSTNYEPLMWFVEFKYLPWDGVYGIGLPEIMDGVAAATTGAARALMDSAHASNFPPAVMLNSAKIAGQNSNVQPGTITRLDVGTSAQQPDIRTLIQTLNIAQPSAVLLQMMDYFDKKAQSFQSNLTGLMENIQGDAPVGTTLALVEESSKRYAAIFARAHDSNHNVLKCICRILSHNLDDQMVIEDLDDLIVTREMFKRNHDVIPVSDPNIFSEAQRFAQLQAVMALAAQAPQLYNMPELNKRALQLINLPDYDKVLAIPQSSGKLNPAAENIAILSGTPIQTFTDQDHLSHIKVHLGICADPVLGMNNMLSAQKLSGLVPHMQEHLVMLYGQIFTTALQQQGKEQSVITGEGDAEADEIIANLNSIVLQQVQEELQPYMQQIAQVQQQVQKMLQQNQPQDPNMMKVQIQQQDVERKMKKDQMDFEVSKEKIAEDLKYDQAMVQVEAIKHQTHTELERSKGQREAMRDSRSSTRANQEMQIKANKEAREAVAQQHKTAAASTKLMVDAHKNAHKNNS